MPHLESVLTLKMFATVAFTLFSLTYRFVLCEWVEILPFRITSNSSLETSTSHELFESSALDLTTPMSYEVNLPKPKFRPSTSNFAHFNTTNEERIKKKGPSKLKKTSFLQFLQAVQENLLQRKFGSYKNKLAVLKDLRDQLLINIKGRIKNLWKPRSAEAREYKDEDYHMDFPSNEGALMTIGFLTFAVFLIKLVIKLIHAIKYKKQYFGNMSTTTTTTAASVIFVKKREVDDEIARISKYIEEFKFP